MGSAPSILLSLRIDWIYTNPLLFEVWWNAATFSKMFSYFIVAAFFGSSLTDDSNSLLSGSVVGSSAPAVGSVVHSTDLNLHSLLSGDLDNTTGVYFWLTC